MIQKNINNILEALKAYWLFIIPHHLFSRFTYIITRTSHPLTGYLIKETQEWELSMFGPAIILYSLGIAAYWKWGSGERLVSETKVNVE